MSRDHPVQILENQGIQDSSGGKVDNWVSVRNWWVRSEPIRGDEQFVDNAHLSVTYKRLTGRYMPDFELSNEHQILLNRKQLRIIGIRNIDDRNEKLEVVAAQ